MGGSTSPGGLSPFGRCGRCAPCVCCRSYPDCDPAEREHSCPFFSRRAVDVVDAHDPALAPLFLYVAWTEVHAPCFVGQGPLPS